MHFRDRIQYLLKSKEKFVLISSLFEPGPDRGNKWYVLCFWVKEHASINGATAGSWHCLGTVIALVGMNEIKTFGVEKYVQALDVLYKNS